MFLLRRSIVACVCKHTKTKKTAIFIHKRWTPNTSKKCKSLGHESHGSHHREKKFRLQVTSVDFPHTGTAHVDSVLLSLTSAATHVGMAIWFVSALVYRWLNNSERLQCAKTAKHHPTCQPARSPALVQQLCRSTV